MLKMSQINHIKDLSNCGYRISEISEKQVRILKQYGNIWRRRIFAGTTCYPGKTLKTGSFQTGHSGMAG